MKHIIIDMTKKYFYEESGVIPEIISQCCSKIGYSDNESYDPFDISVTFIIADSATRIGRYLKNIFYIWRYRYDMNSLVYLGFTVYINSYRKGSGPISFNLNRNIFGGNNITLN